MKYIVLAIAIMATMLALTFTVSGQCMTSQKFTKAAFQVAERDGLKVALYKFEGETPGYVIYQFVESVPGYVWITFWVDETDCPDPQIGKSWWTFVPVNETIIKNIEKSEQLFPTEDS